jgi:hypothetical protein
LDIAQNRPVNFSLNADGDVRLFEMSIELGQQEQVVDPRRPNHQHNATVSITNATSS